MFASLVNAMKSKFSFLRRMAGIGLVVVAGWCGYSVSIDFGSRRKGMMPMKVMPSLFIHGFS